MKINDGCRKKCIHMYTCIRLYPNLTRSSIPGMMSHLSGLEIYCCHFLNDRIQGREKGKTEPN